jgi:cytochrome c553
MSQLKKLKVRERTNDAGSMASSAQTLFEKDMANLSHWISSLYQLVSLIFT